jgi:hypothetical protein
VARSSEQPSISVQERWEWDDNPDNHHHRWGNYCLSCRTEDYKPFSPKLWHYCINCAQVCQECGLPKPIIAFPYDVKSEAYKNWRIAYKAGKPIGRAPREAHIQTCNHCHGRYLDEIDAADKTKELRKTKAAIEDPSAQAALNLMLGKS